MRVSEGSIHTDARHVGYFTNEETSEGFLMGVVKPVAGQAMEVWHESCVMMCCVVFCCVSGTRDEVDDGLKPRTPTTTSGEDSFR